MSAIEVSAIEVSAIEVSAIEVSAIAAIESVRYREVSAIERCPL